MEPPEKPSVNECCSNGCNPCILDVYEIKLKQYQKYLRNQGINRISLKHNLISEIQFRKFTVIQAEVINSGHKMITLKYKVGHITSNESLYYRPGQYFLLRIKNQDLQQYTRAYTPLPFGDIRAQSEPCDTFRIIVKLYKDGTVSKFLHNLRIGDVTEWRGPYGTFQYEANTYNKICMIAQGTAITTLYSIIKTIIENEDDMTFVKLLYCCKDITDILFRYELIEMKQFWNFQYKIFLGTPNDYSANVEYSEPIVWDKLDLREIKCCVDPTDSNSAVFVCGSNSFMTFFKDKLLYKIKVLEENLYCFE